MEPAEVDVGVERRDVAGCALARAREDGLAPRRRVRIETVLRRRRRLEAELVVPQRRKLGLNQVRRLDNVDAEAGIDERTPARPSE